MPFKKKHKLSKGRPQGSKNKSTQEVRENFQKLVEENIDQLREDFKCLEPKDRIKYILHMSKFVLPTLKAIDMDFTQTNVKPLEVNFHYTDEELENRIFELIKKRDDNND